MQQNAKLMMWGYIHKCLVLAMLSTLRSL